MAVTMKNAVFWDVAQCRHCVSRRFGGKYRLHLQGRNKNLRARDRREQAAADRLSLQPSAHAGVSVLCFLKR
jgi:hypothetical protein